ncbi:DUF4258 domain-containing protein [Pseudomonas cichorii]|uniref:DUF4258 domain-containing protein n=2 Tax=Pseudomonas cichorii TaxID=36746 RepID=UPI00046C9C01|nr:DUF4258 domain-containing protein [Pseudomonas cichorii]QVE17031.1 DUF4258 domain-containing protein [Pseudomonas cichorii]SDO80121.1 protein of unknown function [Pseudomonas cichorii]
MKTEPLWAKQQLEDLVHALAQESSRVVFTNHCLERMVERGISTIEVIRCLRRGVIVRGPTYSHAHMNIEFRMSEPPPRDVVCVVVAIKPEPEPSQLFTITVWEI